MAVAVLLGLLPLRACSRPSGLRSVLALFSSEPPVCSTRQGFCFAYGWL